MIKEKYLEPVAPDVVFDGNTAVCASPAKVNIFLHVVGKRSDGYHDLETLICPITLHDTVSFAFGGSGITVMCDHPGVPDGPENIAWRAAHRFFETTGIAPGAAIRIKKRIPVAAGLGGGSGNGAVVLSALNQYHDMPLSRKEMATLATTLGADVPFFLDCRPALATGIGDHLTPVTHLPSYYVVLAAFDFSVSTKSVYQRLKFGLTNTENQNKKNHFREHIFTGDNRCGNLHDGLFNDLEAVTIPDHPVIEDVRQALLMHGAEGVLMSGSGPTVFGLFSRADVALTTRNCSMPESVARMVVARLMV